uniref:Uncharacterized protein n=1 Tax=Arundo donax TaxID=35708 RepID=A0A0A9GQR8_ARUDO
MNIFQLDNKKYKCSANENVPR